MTAEYKAYNLSDAAGNALLQTDFSDAVSVNPELLGFVVGDLSSFTLDGGGEYKSELTLLAGDEALTVLRDYTNNQINYNPSDKGSVDEWLSSKIGVEQEEWVNEFVVTGSERPEAAQINTLEQQLSEKGGESAVKLFETEKKILGLEQELSAQKKADEAQLALGEMQSQVQEIESTLQGVDELLQKQKDIENKISQYEAKESDEQRLASLKQEAADMRIKQIQEMNRSEVQKQIQERDGENNKKQKQLMGLPMLVLPSLILIGGLLGYVATESSGIIVVIVLGVILELFIFGLLNMVAAEPKLNLHSNGAATRKDNQQEQSTGDQSSKKLSDIERYFVDRAWGEVFKSELNNIKKEIEERLGGNTYDNLKRGLDVLKLQMDRVKEIADSMQGREISPESYLKKRRELDALRIEKARAESTLESSENSDINDMFNSWRELYTASLVPNDGEEEMSLVETWAQAPVLPLILVDHLKGLSEEAAKKLQQKIESVKSVGQIIFITSQ